MFNNIYKLMFGLESKWLLFKKIQNISKYTGKWNGEVHGRGGTAFEDAVNWFNAHRRDFNTIIFFTDGYADIDLNIMGQSIWVITSNGKHQKYPGQTLYIPKK